jgi:predicted nucleic acid-binding protein
MMPESSKVVDSWAMVAWIRDEAGAESVERFFQQADAGKLQLLMSWINVGETFYILVRKRSLQIAEQFLVRLPSLPIRLVLPNEDDILAAARLKSSRRLAYADAFAAALAIREGATVITGDPELAALKDLLSVDWIGPKR